MKWVLPVIFIVFLLPSIVSAQNASEEYNESFFCRNAVLRWLFRPNCPSLNPPPSPEQTSPTNRGGSLQLRSFEPPPTNTPTSSSVQCQFPSSGLCGENCSVACRGSNSCWECPAFIPSSAPTPTIPLQCQFPSSQLCGENCSGSCRGSGSCWECSTFVVSPTPTKIPKVTNNQASATPQNFPTQKPGGNSTLQVDWVHNDKGICWAAWAASSCSLSSHEGGLSASPFDITGDGTADVSCSQGSAASQSTTITNISNKPISLRCERYACNSCKSGNGTHAQCDGGIDPSSARVAQEYTLAPGTSATCSSNGIGTGRQSAPSNIPEPVPEPKNPTQTDPPQRPTPTLLPGQSPPIVTSCRVGEGHCSVENMLRYFSNYTAAYKASVICQAESGGNAQALNTGCLTGRSYDYSVGLFQFNMIAHCEGAVYGDGTTCRVVNQAKLDSCLTQFKNPEYNIQRAASLSKNGTDWYPTWGAAGPRYCNIP